MFLRQVAHFVSGFAGVSVSAGETRVRAAETTTKRRQGVSPVARRPDDATENVCLLDTGIGARERERDGERKRKEKRERSLTRLIEWVPAASKGDSQGLTKIFI